MMAYVAKQVADIADMPRGGPDASCLERLLPTSRPEYLDRDDVDDKVKRGIVRTLDRIGTLFGEHGRNSALVLHEVADVIDPRILLGLTALATRLTTVQPGCATPPCCCTKTSDVLAPKSKFCQLNRALACVWVMVTVNVLLTLPVK